MATPFTAERTAIFIEDNDFTTANEKAPFAVKAVVQSCLLLKDRTFTKRPNDKLVPGVRRALAEAVGVVYPKIHELALTQLPDHRKTYGLTAKSNCVPCHNLEILRRNKMSHCILISPAMHLPSGRSITRHPAWPGMVSRIHPIGTRQPWPVTVKATRASAAAGHPSRLNMLYPLGYINFGSYN